MKNIIKVIWICVCLGLAVADIISSFSAFIPPSSFSFISLFAIGFPYIFLATILCCVISFFVDRKLAFLLLLILPLGLYNLSNTIAFNADESWKMEKDPQGLRIMTWNTEGFVSPRPQSEPEAETRIKMLKTIQEFQPDVLCLQEYRNIEGAKWAVPVKEELDSLGYKYYYCSNDTVLHWRKTTHTYGVAIFSKTPFKDSGRVTISTDPRTERLAYTDITFDDKPVRIFSAHLVSFLFVRGYNT